VLAYAPLAGGALSPPSGSGAPTVSTFVGNGLSESEGLAFDAASNLYVANYNSNTISKVTPAGAVSTFVTSGLNGPRGLAFDAAGNLFVANWGNSTISKVTPGGAVSTFVGSGLYQPWGLAFGAAGNLYVANCYGDTIFKVTPSGAVSTFVSSGLAWPAGLAFDAAGNLYVADNWNNTTSEVTPAGVVSTFVSSGLSSPKGLAFDAAGNLYAANYGNTVSEVTPAGSVSTFVSSGLDDAYGLAFDSAGDLYVANNGNNTISKIAPPVLLQGQAFSGRVLRFADSNPQATAGDFTAVVTLGDGNSVSLNSSGVVSGPAGAGGRIVADPAGGFDVWLSYTYTEALSNATFAVQVTELGGASTSASTSAFSVAPTGPYPAYAPLAGGALSPPSGLGAPTVTTFVSNGLSEPEGLAFDTAGNLYVANYNSNTISELTPAGAASTFVSSGLNGPAGLAFDAAGNLYVANWGNSTISKVTPAGAVSTFVSSGLYQPWGLAFDAAGNLYVANCYGDTIFKVTPAGAVSTFVSSGLAWPTGLAFDAAGNLYVANNWNNTISEVTPAGAVSTFVSSGLAWPEGLAFDAAGNLYVANNWGNTISEVTPAGAVSTFVSSGLNDAYGLAFDAAGNLYVANYGNNTISKIAPPVLLQGQPFSGRVLRFADSNQQATVGDFTAVVTLGDGNSVTLKSSGVVSGPAGAGGRIVANPQGGFDVQLSYTYAKALSNATFAVQVTALGAASASASTSAFSVEPPATTTTVSSSQPSAVYGTPVTFTANISATGGNVAPTQGSVDFYDTTTGADLGLGTFAGSAGTTSTWTLTTGVKSFRVTPGDAVRATYSPGPYFAASSGTMIEAVTKAPLTITAQPNAKTCDGTTSATAVPIVTGLVGSDTVTGLTETYDTAQPGTGKTLMVGAGYTVNDGNSGKNYAVTLVSNTQGVIIGGLSVAYAPLAGGALSPPCGIGTPTLSTFAGNGIREPTGLAFDAAGNLYVANEYNGTISEVTPAGAVSTFVSSGLGVPGSLAFDAAGNLYVANYSNSTISKVTPAGAVSTFVSIGLDGPSALAFDAAGNLYAANDWNWTISKVTPAGAVSTIVSSGLIYPDGLAFDAAGNLYVANHVMPGTISKVTPGGAVSTFVSGALDDPQALAFDAAGNLYIDSYAAGTVFRVTPTGAISTFAGTGLNFPNGLAFDAAGNLYVANGQNSTISKIAAPVLGKYQPFSGIVFRFNDYDPQPTASDFTAAVTLGDGNSVTLNSSGAVSGPAGAGGQIVADPNGGFDVQLSYTYTEALTNATFAVQVTDLSGDATSASTNTFSVAPTTATTTTVSSSQPSAVYGTPVTFTANVSASDGNVAPTQGSVDFYDTTASADLGLGNFVPSSGTTSTWTLTTGVKSFNVTSGDIITATYTAGTGFIGSSATTIQTVTKAPLTITASPNSKPYDGTTSATAVPTVAGLVGSDTVTGLSETYDTPAVGTGKTLTVAAGYVVGDGNSGNNYAVTTVPNTTGVIAVFNTSTSLITSSGSVVYGTPVAFTATVTASTGSVAPTQGSVDFKDTTTGADLGNGTFVTSSGTSSTWTFTTGVKTFNVTEGDSIQATYAPGLSFLGSFGTTTQAVTVLPITVTAVANTKTYDGTTTSAAAPVIGAVVTTLAGSVGQTGSSDGTGSAARFDEPEGTVVDSSGNVYVADTYNDEIRKITPSGVVSTLAGSAGRTGSSDGTGGAARFDDPWGVAVDSAGNVYVADTYNDEIRKITPSGVVSTLAGSAGQTGSSDGTGGAARFDYPTGVAVDSAGNVYVADLDNNEIRKISPSGVVTTLAGSAGQYGSSDGTGSAARFHRTRAVAVDGAGNVYVADQNNDEIRKITPSGVVSTLAGSAGQTGSSDGTGSAARFDVPTGVAVDSAGNVYVADEGNDEIRKITPSGVVSTLAGSAGKTGSSDGPGSAARFDLPAGVALDSAGNLYVADQSNDEIREISGNTGLVAGDTAAFTETFDTRNAGTGKTLTPAGSVNDGNNGNNYAVAFVSNTTGAINQAGLTITAATNTKTYDGTTVAAATPTVVGLLAGDTVTSLSETYADPNAGQTKTLHAAYTISDGNNGNNYTVTVDSATGTINPATLTVTADAQTKVYGQSDPALTYTATGYALGDSGATVLTGGLARDPGENVGGYAIRQGSLTSNANYTINYVGANLTITPATLTVTADAQTEVYGQSDPALTYTATGYQFTDCGATVLAGSLARDPGENVGSYAIREGSLSSNPDYTISYVGANLTITPAMLTPSITAAGKTYDGTTRVTLTSQTVATVIGSDQVSLEVGAACFTCKNVGLETVTATGLSLSGSGAANYRLSSTTASTTATISAPSVPLKVIDDSSTAFQATSGTWSPGTAAGSAYLGSDHEAASAGASATWTFSGLTPGATYTVYATWPAASNRATNVPYTVTANGATTPTSTVNQRSAPSISVANSGPTGATPWSWTELGSYVYTVGADGKLVVGISSAGTTGKVEADAVMIQLVTPELAAGGLGDNPNAAPLTASEAMPLVREAELRWAAAGANVAGLTSVQVVVGNLPGTALGDSSAGVDTIFLDANAKGWGWFIDPTPSQDNEFPVQVARTEEQATSGPAAGQMDLLTVIMHEMGHFLGHSDLSPQAFPYDLMSADLAVGIRRLPQGAVAAAAARGTSAPTQAGGQDIAAAAQARAKDAVFAALAQPQGGSTVGKSAGNEPRAWWLSYGEN
jgi:sugar lactone lactonase YvrE